MSYDRKSAGNGPLTLGWDGATIDLGPGDFQVPDSTKAIVVTTSGNVACKPVNAAVHITLTSLPAGYILPWHCSHIRKAGTTAVLATVAG
jgi:hypothetical protein